VPSSSAEALEPADTRELRLKLTWLAVFRVSVTSLLLVFLAVRRVLGPPGELSTSDSFAFGLIGIVYLLTLAYAVALRLGIAGRRAAYVQVMGDVVLATSVIFLTGVGDSPFAFTYSIAVVAAAILLYTRGALVAAAAATLAFAAVVLAVQFDVLDPPLDAPRLSVPRLTFLLASNSVAQFSIGILASYLSRQVAAAGGRLIAREARIEQLVGLQNLIVAAMPSGLVSCDGEGKVTFVNPAAEQILGRVSGDWPEHIEELLPGVSKLKSGTRRAELEAPTTAGPRVLGLAVTPLEEKTGSRLVVFQDLTELRRAEEQLRTADHLASLGKLSAQLAHEIRNPLASMRGAAQMLADDQRGQPSQARLAGILMRESDRLSALVDDFLRFARPPPPRLEPLDLGKLVEETVEMLRADPLSRGVTLVHQCEPVMGQGDAAQLRQLLINLVKNALAAVGPSGRVKVTVAQRAGVPEIRVWDSAGKIPPGELMRIFEPFYTTREGGTGLGLSTAYTIVRGHGGAITVSSAPEAGTEFVVALTQSGGGTERADSGR
jgi:two-component system sensor histidine kinase PilS (NtrC family)